jgi:hypothetical protein
MKLANSKLFVLAAAGVLALGMVALSVPVRAADQRQPNSLPQHELTWADIENMSPAQVGALQGPLLDAGTPIALLGQTARWSGLYGGMALDTPDHLVDLYVTNTARAGQLLAAARSANPGLDIRLIRVFRTGVSVGQYEAAATRLLDASRAGLLPFRVNAVSLQQPSASVQVLVSRPVADQRMASLSLADLGGRSITAFAGVSLTFAGGAAPVNANRQDDTRPFIGGDGLSGGGRACTAGIAVENPRSHEDYLITAAHCFKKGSRVSTWDGIYVVGKVTAVAGTNDAELIDTGYRRGKGSNADEGEANRGVNGILWHPLLGTAAFMAHEVIFQDGLSTFFARGGVQEDFTQGLYAWGSSGPNGNFNVEGYSSITDHLKTCSSSHPLGCAVIGGDSGAVVFIYNGGHREALGMVSAGTGGTNCNEKDGVYCYRMLFASALLDYHDLGVVLNPHH